MLKHLLIARHLDLEELGSDKNILFIHVDNMFSCIVCS